MVLTDQIQHMVNLYSLLNKLNIWWIYGPYWLNLNMDISRLNELTKNIFLHKSKLKFSILVFHETYFCQIWQIFKWISASCYCMC